MRAGRAMGRRWNSPGPGRGARCLLSSAQVLGSLECGQKPTEMKVEARKRSEKVGV